MKHASLLAAAVLAVSGAAALPAAPAFADDLVYTGLFSNTGAGGYDVVAYHGEGGPMRGSRDFETRWNGADWRFASQANLDLFLANPETYAPQYGGYCAWAMAEGYTAKGDPEFWNLVDGKLYLNFNRDVQQTWEEDIPGNIERADANYPAILED
ncbi:YHS domain-containing (seleno)protein [Maricaulaceae bacterium MS644]